jgi:hypothetical protein
MNRDGLGSLVPDGTIASPAAATSAARGLISAAYVGRRLVPVPQIEPVLESTLTPTDWLHIADALEAKAAELDASDPEIGQIYRRDACRIRAQWTRK